MKEMVSDRNVEDVVKVEVWRRIRKRVVDVNG
jgi:hypothetical protein